jgi:hypothetical protein
LPNPFITSFHIGLRRNSESSFWISHQNVEEQNPVTIVPRKGTDRWAGSVVAVYGPRAKIKVDRIRDVEGIDQVHRDGDLIVVDITITNSSGPTLTTTNVVIDDSFVNVSANQLVANVAPKKNTGTNVKKTARKPTSVKQITKGSNAGKKTALPKKGPRNTTTKVVTERKKAVKKAPTTKKAKKDNRKKN